MRVFRIFLAILIAVALRLPVAIILTFAITALVTLIWYSLDSSGIYSDSSNLFQAISVPLTITLLPAILIACLRKKRGLKSRLISSLKTMGVVLLLFVAWNGYFVSLIISSSSDPSTDPQRLSLIANIGFYSALFILSTVLALIWYPSKKIVGASPVPQATKFVPTAPRPFAIKMFEYLMAAYVVVGVVQLSVGFEAAQWFDEPEGKRALTESIIDRLVEDDPLMQIYPRSLLVEMSMAQIAHDYSITYIAIGAGWMLAMIVLVVLISRFFMKNVRYILSDLLAVQTIPTILYILGIGSFGDANSSALDKIIGGAFVFGYCCGALFCILQTIQRLV